MKEKTIEDSKLEFVQAITANNEQGASAAFTSSGRQFSEFANAAIALKDDRETSFRAIVFLLRQVRSEQDIQKMLAAAPSQEFTKQLSPAELFSYKQHLEAVVSSEQLAPEYLKRGIRKICGLLDDAIAQSLKEEAAKKTTGSFSLGIKPSTRLFTGSKGIVKFADISFIPPNLTHDFSERQIEKTEIPKWADTEYQNNRSNAFKSFSYLSQMLQAKLDGRFDPVSGQRFIELLHPLMLDLSNPYGLEMWRNVFGQLEDGPLKEKVLKCLSDLRKGDAQSAFKDAVNGYGVELARLVTAVRVQTLIAYDANLTLRLPRSDIFVLPDFFYLGAREMQGLSREVEFTPGEGLKLGALKQRESYLSFDAWTGKTYNLGIIDGSRLLIAEGIGMDGNNLKFKLHGAIDLGTGTFLNGAQLAATYEKSLKSQNQSLGITARTPELKIPVGKGLFFRAEGSYQGQRDEKTFLRSWKRDLLKTKGTDLYELDGVFIKKGSGVLKELEISLGKYWLYQPALGEAHFDVSSNPTGSVSGTFNLGKNIDLRMQFDARKTPQDEWSLGVRAGVSVPVSFRKD